MCNPVGNYSPPPGSREKRRPPPIDLRAVEQTEEIFQKKLAEYQVGSPIRDPRGRPKEGHYKRLLKTGRRDRVALASSPHRTKNPKGYYETAIGEIAILRRFQGKGPFPALIDSFEIPGKKVVTIQENLGPSLFDVYLSRTHPHDEIINLARLQKICRQLLQAASVLHKEGVLHGDIKPENSNREGVLFDFGLSEEIGTGDTRRKKYSRPYRPPETVTKCKTSLSGDVWALGALFFELFSKEELIPVHDSSDPNQDDINMVHAFRDRLELEYSMDHIPEEYRKYTEIKEGRLEFKPPTTPRLDPYRPMILKYGKVWEPFADLLKNMLQFYPKRRITVEGALSHPFFSKDLNEVSFKLDVRGNFKGKLRIKNHSNTVLAVVDLSKLEPDYYFHIGMSSHPYIVEAFHPANPEKIIHTFEMGVPSDRATVTIDTTLYSE